MVDYLRLVVESLDPALMFPRVLSSVQSFENQAVSLSFIFLSKFSSRVFATWVRSNGLAGRHLFAATTVTTIWDSLTPPQQGSWQKHPDHRDTRQIR